MELDKVQVRVYRPLVGEALREENAMRARRAEIDDDMARQTLALADLEGMDPRDDEVLAQVRQELVTLEAKRRELQEMLDTRWAGRTVTIDVQTATFGGRMRQMTAGEEVDAWQLAQKRANLGLTAGDPDPSRAELEAVPLTEQQREDYAVMYSCAAIVGAVCRDGEGKPVVSNFEWPAHMHGWTQVPAYIVEPVLMQVYTLNPSWMPGWMAVPEEPDAKNG